MKTRTSLVSLFALLSRPLFDALRDECSVWKKSRSSGGEVRNPPAADHAANLAPIPVAKLERTETISVMVAAAEPDKGFIQALAEPTGIPVDIAPEPVVNTTPATVVAEEPASVVSPEPAFTVAAEVKHESKPVKRTRKPALAMAGAARATVKKPRKSSGKPVPRPKRSPACSAK